MNHSETKITHVNQHNVARPDLYFCNGEDFIIHVATPEILKGYIPKIGDFWVIDEEGNESIVEGVSV